MSYHQIIKNVYKTSNIFNFSKKITQKNLYETSTENVWNQIVSIWLYSSEKVIKCHTTHFNTINNSDLQVILRSLFFPTTSKILDCSIAMKVAGSDYYIITVYYGCSYTSHPPTKINHATFTWIRVGRQTIVIIVLKTSTVRPLLYLNITLCYVITHVYFVSIQTQPTGRGINQR